MNLEQQPIDEGAQEALSIKIPLFLNLTTQAIAAQFQTQRLQISSTSLHAPSK